MPHQAPRTNSDTIDPEEVIGRFYDAFIQGKAEVLLEDIVSETRDDDIRRILAEGKGIEVGCKDRTKIKLDNYRMNSNLPTREDFIEAVSHGKPIQIDYQVEDATVEYFVTLNINKEGQLIIGKIHNVNLFMYNQYESVDLADPRVDMAILEEGRVLPDDYEYNISISEGCDNPNGLTSFDDITVEKVDEFGNIKFSDDELSYDNVDWDPYTDERSLRMKEKAQGAHSWDLANEE